MTRSIRDRRQAPKITTTFFTLLFFGIHVFAFQCPKLSSKLTVRNAKRRAVQRSTRLDSDDLSFGSERELNMYHFDAASTANAQHGTAIKYTQMLQTRKPVSHSSCYGWPHIFEQLVSKIIFYRSGAQLKCHFGKKTFKTDKSKMMTLFLCFFLPEATLCKR